MLELAVARALYERFPDFAEGRMAKVRSHVVSRASCAVVVARARARRAAAGGRGVGLTAEEAERLAQNRNVLAAVLEAALAALFLEHGFEHIEPAIVDAFDPRIEYAVNTHVDHKTELQERARAHRARRSRTSSSNVEGPPHDRNFTAAAVIDERDARHRAAGRRRRTPSRPPPRRRSRRSAQSRREAGPIGGLIPTGRAGLEPHPGRPIASLRRAPEGDHPARLQVVRRPCRDSARAGVAVVVGPNGSGKSNVSDSILWATGSMSPGELRAEKPDDVLFAGSGGREAVDTCEVDLLFDNADGAWPDLPFAEVSVARRLHRGGEGQYLVNRAAVRRLDLVELLSDVGLGGGLRSVISQGRVETVLNSKPVERRELVEEAAGLGRFKRRRHRAELKLARVAVQVDRARDLEDEVRKRLRPLALQATAAERAEKLGFEIARLQAAIATLDLARLAERRSGPTRRRSDAAEERRILDAKIAELVAARERAEVELTDAAGAREGTTAALYRLRFERRADRAPPRGCVAARGRPGRGARGRTHARPARLGRARGRGPRRRDGRAARRVGARAAPSWRRRSNGRASPRSSGVRRPGSRPSWTSCSGGAARPRRC